MAISLASLQKGVSQDAPVICIYGDSGIGKSTFGANAPNPVFLFTENGRGKLDVAGWEVNSFEEVMEALEVLVNDEHDFNALVLDSLDWFEPLVWKYLISDRPHDEKGRVVKDVSDYGYGKGYSHALDYWQIFIDYIKRLRKEKNMAVILVGHDAITKISPPDGDSYDSWSLKLQNSDKISAREKIIESCDAVLFAKTKDARTDDENASANKSRTRAIGSGERVIYTEKRPAWEAKNRYSLPPQINVKEKDWSDVWGVLAANIPWFRQFDEPEQPQVKQEAKKPEPVVEKEVAETPAATDARPKFLKTKS